MRLPLFLFCALLGGCSFSVPFVDDKPAPAPTLADLEPAVIPEQGEPLPAVELDTLIDTYRDVLAFSDDPVIELKVRQRLAGLEMLRGEARLYENQDADSVFALAIAAYQQLLEQHPDRPDNDRLLYQLSKAYDLSGQPDQSLQVLTRLVQTFPASVHFTEAEFRRAEIFFARGEYAAAEQAYGNVIARGGDSTHYRNALYMHGWSQFKRNRYRASLQSFTETLDLLVPADSELEGLSRGERELVTDSLRIMSVVFAYLDGPQTIAEVYAALGQRHYQHLIYDALGEHYLEQERYQDSAETYKVFVQQHPQSDWAPVLYVKLIDSYAAGDFPAQVLAGKEQFVARYGAASNYWAAAEPAVRERIAPHLKAYLGELARHYHAQAQRTSKRLADAQAGKKGADGKALDAAALDAQMIEQYRRAGDYYQAFIVAFPTAPEVPEMAYLMAEARFESRDYPGAIEAYETVAYDYSDHERGADAGYAAIVAYDRHLERLPQADTESWRQLKVTSELRFAQTYSDDERAPAVLTRAAQELLELEDYAGAVTAARQLVQREPAAEADLRRTAWLVIGHGEFEQAHYAAAESAYTEARALLSPDDERYAAVVDRLAASVYRQGEAALAAGEPRAAAAQFLRVAAVAPTSEIRINAQYDAATQLYQLGDYAEAITIFNEFRDTWPQHALSADIPAKLAEAYQETGQWSLAADELLHISRDAEDPVVKRETLYLAAELYEKAGATDPAIVHYRDYAHAYPEPFAIAMEARYRLSELYRETGEQEKRRFWLRKMIAAHREAGEAGTDRSRYLAAFSSQVLADDAYQAFARIPLTLPLNKSLKRKKAALEETLDAYQLMASYGVGEFVTEATYRIGEIYAQLSRDLLDSERPDNLDALALEQYQILLEEQAFPFEEKAIDIHETNTRRSWEGVYDPWVQRSFEALARLLPARYGKDEQQLSVSDEIY